MAAFSDSHFQDGTTADAIVYNEETCNSSCAFNSNGWIPNYQPNTDEKKKTKLERFMKPKGKGKKIRDWE